MIAWLLTAETGKHAGPDGLTGQLNCAGAALCDTAAELRARQSQDIAPAYPAGTSTDCGCCATFHATAPFLHPTRARVARQSSASHKSS